MRTDDLIELLASRAEPVARRSPAATHAKACAAAALVATALLLGWLGVRADLPDAVATPVFWLKLTFVSSLVVAGLVATARLSRPGATLGAAVPMFALPVALMALIATAELLATPPTERASLVFGDMWVACAPFIVALSLPVFVAAMWSVSRLAPTRLRTAGAAAGLLAGATGALVYSFHCPVGSVPYVAVWYLMGMLVPASIGAALGPRLLRW